MEVDHSLPSTYTPYYIFTFFRLLKPRCCWEAHRPDSKVRCKAARDGPGVDPASSFRCCDLAAVLKLPTEAERKLRGNEVLDP